MSLDKFYKQSKRKDGRGAMCKSCMKEKYRDSRKKNYQEHKEERKEYQLNYSKKYRKENSEYFENYRKNNKEHIHSLIIKRARERRKEDPAFRILCSARSRLHQVLKSKKCDSTINLIGCTPNELKQHLENQFIEGMSWDNYGEWHIDHIKPCAAFNFELEEKQSECFHYSNLQPLWAIDNLKKSAKYIVEQ